MYNIKWFTHVQLGVQCGCFTFVIPSKLYLLKYSRYATTDGNIFVNTFWKSILWLLRKSGIDKPQFPSITPLSIYPKDAPPYHKITYSAIFTAALLVTARN